MTALYPEKPEFDIAGFPRVRAQDLVDDLVAQAALADPLYLLGHRALELEEDEEEVTVRTDQGAVVRARALLVTGGMGGFTPRALPAGGEYEGRGLRYTVPRPTDLAGKHVSSAAGTLPSTGRSCSNRWPRASPWPTDRDAFRAHEHSVAQLRASTVQLLTPYEVSAVRGADAVSEVDLIAPDGGTTLAVTEVVAALGFQADLKALATWGIDLTRRHIPVDRSMRTNRARVFAAGDIADFPGKVRLISVGFGEAALAVDNLAPLVRPDLAVVPGHSSDIA